MDWSLDLLGLEYSYIGYMDYRKQFQSIETNVFEESFIWIILKNLFFAFGRLGFLPGQLPVTPEMDQETPT